MQWNGIRVGCVQRQAHVKNDSLFQRLDLHAGAADFFCASVDADFHESVLCVGHGFALIIRKTQFSAPPLSAKHVETLDCQSPARQPSTALPPTPLQDPTTPPSPPAAPAPTSPIVTSAARSADTPTLSRDTPYSTTATTSPTTM